MTFSAKQLGGVVNFWPIPNKLETLALAREAAARGLLVSDLVAQTMASMFGVQFSSAFCAAYSPAMAGRGVDRRRQPVCEADRR